PQGQPQEDGGAGDEAEQRGLPEAHDVCRVTCPSGVLQKNLPERSDSNNLLGGRACGGPGLQSGRWHRTPPATATPSAPSGSSSSTDTASPTGHSSPCHPPWPPPAA